MLLILFSMLCVNFLNAQCSCTIPAINPFITSEFPITQTSATGWCKQITGTFTIDRDFEFINSKIEMLNNSSILIKAGVTLTINGTRIYGCSNNWDNIELETNTSKFYSKLNSQIHDALHGVSALNGGTVSIDNTIVHNFIGVEMSKDANVTISNSSNFLPNGAASKGIDINTPSNAILNISNTTFSDYELDFPIIGSNGSIYLNIKQSTFNSPIGLGQPGCIQLLNLTGTKIIDNCHFSKVLNSAIEVNQGSGVEIKNHNVFEGCANSVLVSQVSTGSILVSNCDIREVTGNLAVTNGIIISGNIESVPINVYNNFIENAGTSGILHRGLLLDQHSAVYSYNTIRNFIDNNSIGIRLSSPRKLYGYHNTIFNSVSSSDCIRFESGENNSFYENDLNTELFLCNSSTGTGFNVNASQMNSYFCNATNNRELGFRSDGACDFSSLLNNGFVNHFVGLRVENGSAIGVQVHNWNQWSGTYASGLGAENLNPLPSVANSKFTVATSVGTVYHPQNSGNGFFQQVVVPLPTTAACEPESGDEERNNLRANLTNSINGLNSNSTYDAVNYDSRLLSYRLLDEDVSLRTEQNLFSSFYSSNTLGSIGRFNSAIKSWRNHQNAVPYPAIATTYNNFIAAQDNYVSLLSSNASNNDINNAKASVDALNQQYKNEKTANDNYLSNVAQQISSDVNSLNVSTIYENNIKDYYTIYFSTIAVKSFVLTENQKQKLFAIANQCPLTGGKIVYDARGLYESLYGLSNSFNDDALCNLIGQRSDEKYTESNSIKVYPNPTESNVWIDLGKTKSVENLNLSIFDMNGRLLKNNNISFNNSPISINVNELKSGIYIIQLKDNTNIIYKDKLIILK